MFVWALVACDFAVFGCVNVERRVCCLQEAAARLEEVKKSVEAKLALRQSNLNPERPGK